MKEFKSSRPGPKGHAWGATLGPSQSPQITPKLSQVILSLNIQRLVFKMELSTYVKCFAYSLQVPVTRLCGVCHEHFMEYCQEEFCYPSKELKG